METNRCNTSSAAGGVFPYYSSFAAPAPGFAAQSDARITDSADTMHALPVDPARGDRISISPQARWMQASSSSLPGSMIQMPPENFALYNQLRRERDTLPPGDPRIMQLTGELRAVLMAGDTPLPPEDRLHTATRDQAPRPAAPATAQTLPVAPQSANDSANDSARSVVRPTGRPEERDATTPFGQTGSSAASKNRHRGVGMHDSADTRFTTSLPYAPPESSHDSAGRTPYASASASSTAYAHALPGTLEHQRPLNMSHSGRLHRVA